MRKALLLCLLSACGSVPLEVDAGTDAGPKDAGHDAGMTPDAGPVPDAGCAILFPPGSMVHFPHDSVQGGTWCQRVCDSCQHACAPGVESPSPSRHGLSPGQRFTLEPGEQFFPAGEYAVSAVRDEWTFEWTAQPEEFVHRNDLWQCLKL